MEFNPEIEEKRELAEHSGIRFWLDSYQDIFSDFDPRQYKQKALSTDFLDEAKRACIDKEHPVTLTLLIPKEKRRVNDEKIIKSRLEHHFHRHHELLGGERAKIIKKGLMFAVAGIILMFVATYVLFKFEERSFWASLFVVILEPGGWFLFWEGLYQVVFEESRERKKEFAFYKKMAGSRIVFSSYKIKQ